LPTTRPYEIRVQATLEKPDQISTMPTCGDNAETDLRVLAGGRIAEPQLQSGHAERRNQCRYRGQSGHDLLRRIRLLLTSGQSPPKQYLRTVGINFPLVQLIPTKFPSILSTVVRQVATD
jgi:hypothetical protein